MGQLPTLATPQECNFGGRPDVYLRRPGSVRMWKATLRPERRRGHLVCVKKPQRSIIIVLLWYRYTILQNDSKVSCKWIKIAASWSLIRPIFWGSRHGGLWEVAIFHHSNRLEIPWTNVDSATSCALKNHFIWHDKLCYSQSLCQLLYILHLTIDNVWHKPNNFSKLFVSTSTNLHCGSV